MSQLPWQDAKVIRLQKFDLFLRAAGEQLRDELESALDLLNPDWIDVPIDWRLMDWAVMRVYEKRRRDKEATKGVVGRKRYLGREREGVVESGGHPRRSFEKIHTFEREDEVGLLKGEEDEFDVHDSQARQESILKEGPHGVDCTRVGGESENGEKEDEWDKASFEDMLCRKGNSLELKGTLGQEQVGVIGEDERKEAVTWSSVTMEAKELLQEYNESGVKSDGMKNSDCALLDLGSEEDLGSMNVDGKGRWTVARDSGWRMRYVNSNRDIFRRVCSRIDLQIKDIEELINMFVHEDLLLRMSLGQRFTMKTKKATMVLDKQKWWRRLGG
ncbi:unnamed protein product [Calypogeia fissa]